MLGSEFLAQFKDKGRVAWEAAALALAQQGSAVPWPMVNLALSVAADAKRPAHSAVLPVASDVLSIGTKEDFLRLPLTPSAAQAILNLGGFLLPTPKIAHAIQKAAATQGVQLPPAPQQNRAPFFLMEDYAKHDVTVNRQLNARNVPFGALVSGHKKDVIISNIYKPGRVLIYGWFWPDGTKTPAGFSQPIQARSNVHDDKWVDYSHGIRLVSPVMTVDGESRRTEDVLRDPDLSRLLSDEGPLHMLRYPASNDPVPFRPANKAEYAAFNDVYPRYDTTSLADQGLAVMIRSRKP